YDLEADPFEQRNVAQSQPDQCTAMRQRLVEMLRETRDPYWDVLIEEGVEPDGPTLDVNTGKPPELFY
ncbi:MAG: hypothetical protein HOH74_02985, partial [Gemmatimonadetes bacterium]|nr:hypothetical protein [Gemmatimonadota bacterium]